MDRRHCNQKRIDITSVTSKLYESLSTTSHVQKVKKCDAKSNKNIALKSISFFLYLTFHLLLFSD